MTAFIHNIQDVPEMCYHCTKYYIHQFFNKMVPNINSMCRTKLHVLFVCVEQSCMFYVSCVYLIRYHVEKAFCGLQYACTQSNKMPHVFVGELHKN